MELSLTSNTPSVRRNERTGKSAVSNGRRLHVVKIPKGHGTAWQRRFRDVFNEIISDMGGMEGRSEGERQLARRCATLAIECEKLDIIAISGEQINVEQYGALTDRLGRTLQRLGLRRQQREVSWRDQWLSEAAAEQTNEPAATATPSDAVQDDAEDAS
jgi:hypothetical protein